jgi:hypothetical protein
MLVGFLGFACELLFASECLRRHILGVRFLLRRRLRNMNAWQPLLIERLLSPVTRHKARIIATIWLPGFGCSEHQVGRTASRPLQS